MPATKTDPVALKLRAAHVPTEDDVKSIVRHLCMTLADTTETQAMVWKMDDSITVYVKDASMLGPVTIVNCRGRVAITKMAAEASGTTDRAMTVSDILGGRQPASSADAAWLATVHGTRANAMSSRLMVEGDARKAARIRTEMGRVETAVGILEGWVSALTA